MTIKEGDIVYIKSRGKSGQIIKIEKPEIESSLYKKSRIKYEIRVFSSPDYKDNFGKSDLIKKTVEKM